MGGMDLLTAHRDHQALDEVLQLANVSGPAMLFKSGQGGIVDVLAGNTVGYAVGLEKVLAQDRDIAETFAQRRKLYWDDVDTVVKIFPESPCAGHLLKIFVGGADQTKIDLAQVAAAEPLDHVVLEYAEKFGLKGQGKGGDFIEEESATVGQLNLARAGFGGSGESAALAAEEFGLDEILRQSGAVQPDVWFVCARAESHDGASSQLFSSAAFATDQNIDAASGDLLDGIVDGAHRFASADEILESAVLKGLLPHGLAGGFLASRAKEVNQSQPKLRDVDRATKVRVGTRFEGLFFDRASARAAERDEDELTVKSAQFVEDRKATVGALIVAIAGINI